MIDKPIKLTKEEQIERSRLRVELEQPDKVIVKLPVGKRYGGWKKKSIERAWTDDKRASKQMDKESSERGRETRLSLLKEMRSQKDD